MEYTVSMDKPNTHLFQVTFHYSGITTSIVDCKMPVWTPGYYWITNFPKNVFNFSAQSETGEELEWQKIDKNTWRVQNNDNKAIVIKYSIYAFTQSVADPFLDAGRAFISPAGVFMYINEEKKNPITVKIKPYKDWKKISTGLDMVREKANTYYAKNFDILYDSPILIGSQDIINFDFNGKPHHIAMEFSKEFDTARMALDFKKIVETSTSLMGDIPYKNYTFLIMGEGRGGLEHSNSMAVFSNSRVYSPSNKEGYKRWLCFIAHEYYHLYNIKRIRPINLGPFDYNKENFTNMLWFSEGCTVYYEYIITNRAGILSRNDFFNEVEHGIKNYENIPGHLFQSATESSLDTWIKFFGRNENAQNTNISYYDKGFIICLLLDIKIRNTTNNQKSLDDVMRLLYNKYYLKMKRGFKDEELKKECESIAGCSLDEIFNYASSLNKIDYQKYFDYAGLTIDTTYSSVQDCWTGANTQQQGKSTIISSIEWGSPAYNAGLSVQDTILSVDGKEIENKGLREILKSYKNGDTIKFLIANRTQRVEIKVKLESKHERSFKITPKENPTEQQKALLNGWLK